MPPKKTPSKDSTAEGKASADKEAPSLEVKLKEAVRDAQLKLLKEHSGKPEVEEATLTSQLDVLVKENPGHLPILLEKLKQVAAANAKDNKSPAKVTMHPTLICFCLSLEKL